MVVKWLTRWLFSESAKVTYDRYEKNIIAPGLAGWSRLTAQRLLMGFWHASDDIVAGVRQVPRDLPSPYTRPKIIRVWCSRPFPLSARTVLCQINVHPGGCSVETTVCEQRGRLAVRASRQGTDGPV